MAEPKTSRSVVAKTGYFSSYAVVIAAFCILLAYSAGRSAFGIFFDPMVSEFAWSSALMSGAFSLSIIMDGTLGILTGRFADRFGPRKVLTFCGVLAGAGYILISLVNSGWQMYLFYGIVIGTGMAGIFVPVITALSKRFVARRNTINGIVMAGMGLGTLIVAPLANWLISTYHWRTAYIIIGAAFLVIVVVGTQFFRFKSAPIAQVPNTREETNKRPIRPEVRSYSFTEALRTKQLWLIFAMLFCFGFPLSSITVHIVPNVIHLNISAAEAAGVMSIIGLTSILGRVSFGAIADRIGSRQALLLGFIVIAVSIFWLIFIKDIRAFYIFAAIWGFCSSGMGTVQVPLAAELFGPKSLGAIFGFCGLGTMIGASVGPVISGLLFDVTGRYSIAFAICTVMAVSGIILNLVLRQNRVRLSDTGGLNGL